MGSGPAEGSQDDHVHDAGDAEATHEGRQQTATAATKAPAATPASNGAASTASRGKDGASKPARRDTGPRHEARFPVVAIGASAGGFEAFREILRNLPDDIGMALVLVPHLDPTHESQLAPLLSRVTSIPVTEARNGEKVAPNHVYVIPPHSQLRIRHGSLMLEPRTTNRGQPTTIDQFMRSLAEDWGDQAIGVILSGTLSDGTLGLQEIKAAGGFTFSQDLESAKYLEMPRGAIQAGHVDFVLPPAKIAEELYRLGQRLPLRARRYSDGDTILDDADALNQLFSLVRNRTGVDFTHYKRSTLQRRIQRRMTAKRMDTLEEYVRYVQQHHEEARELYEEILIHVTRFYRDKEMYTGLEEVVFPALLKDRDRNDEVRVWVAGCATGEEAYSIAISLAEFQAREGTNVPVQVFATDLSDTAIATARNGIYPDSIVADVPDAVLTRHFQKVDGGYQINKSIRSMCVFAVHDLTRDPPFSNMDLVSCRNVLIYMEPTNQQRVLAVVHYALSSKGFLLLGSSESPNRMPELFTAVGKRDSIYSRNAVRVSPLHALTPAQKYGYAPKEEPSKNSGSWAPTDLERETDKAIIERFGPPAVVLNPGLEAVIFRGDPGLFLQHNAGPASLSIMKLLRDGLALEVHAAVQTVKETGKPVTRHGIRFQGPEKEHLARIDVAPVRGPMQSEPYYLLAFQEETPRAPAPQPPGLLSKLFAGAAGQASEELRERLHRAEQELEATRQYMRTLVEDYETTTEELRCANEEALSSNEELQSTNEELETAKEEAQSTNEELRTLNEELIHRSLEIQKANNDLMNLLNSVDIAIVMLGRSLIIRRFTPRAQELMNLIPTDLGRPITDINPPFEGLDLKQNILSVLDTLQVRKITAKDHDGHELQIQIHPYRTSEDQIDGTVLVIAEPHRQEIE